MLVGLLTVEQKDALIGQLVQPDWYFNPFHNNDVEYSWVISTEEIISSLYPQNDWVKTLPLVQYIEPLPPVSGNSVFDQYFKN